MSAPGIVKSLEPAETPDDVSVEVRRFDDASIQAALDSALNRVPAGQRAAVADVRFKGGDVRAVVMARLDRHWSVAVVGERVDRELSGGAAVRFAW